MLLLYPVMEELLDDTRPALQVGHILVMVEVMVEVIIIQVVGAGLLVEEVRADIQETAVAEYNMGVVELYQAQGPGPEQVEHKLLTIWYLLVEGV